MVDVNSRGDECVVQLAVDTQKYSQKIFWLICVCYQVKRMLDVTDK